jgi:hypothetical protein
VCGKIDDEVDVFSRLNKNHLYSITKIAKNDQDAVSNAETYIKALFYKLFSQITELHKMSR